MSENSQDLLSSAIWYSLFARGILIPLPLMGAGAEGTKACHYLAQGNLLCPEPAPCPANHIPLISQPSFSPDEGEQRGIQLETK